jgi:hypothetical protein
MPVFTPNWARVRFPDLAGIFNAAQQANRDRMRLELNKQKAEAARRNELLVQQRQQAAAKVFDTQTRLQQAEDPKQRELLEAKLENDLGMLGQIDMKAGIELTEFTQDVRQKNVEIGRKQLKQTIDSNLRGAQAIQQLLGPAVSAGPEGADIDMAGILGATSEMRRLAKTPGMITTEQAQAVENLFAKTQAAIRDVQAGRRARSDAVAEIQNIAHPIVQSAQQGIALFGDPEKRKRFQSDIELVAGDVAGITGDPRHFNAEVALTEKPVLFRQAQQKRARAKLARARAVGGIQPPGTVEAEKGAKLTKQLELGAIEDARSKIGILRQVIEPKFFGAEGLFKGAAANAAGWLLGQNAPDVARQYQQARQWLTSFGRIFVLDLLTAKSGKQVTDKEREFLLKAVGDPDNMNYDQYIGALDAMDTMMELQETGAKRVLREGFGVLDDSERERVNADLEKVRSGYDNPDSPLFRNVDEVSRRVKSISDDLSARIALREQKKKTFQTLSVEAQRIKGQMLRGEISEQEAKQQIEALRARGRQGF